MDDIETKFITSQKIPLVIEPVDKKISIDEFTKILKEKNDYFKTNMLKYGGLLFRNFPIESVDDFAKVIDSLGTGSCVDYIGGDSPRVKVKGNIYTSTEAPPTMKIPLHNELSFVKNYRSHIYFYCETPSPEGGQTIIGDTRKIYRDIDENVKKRFVENNLKYVSRYHYKSKLVSLVKSHKTWINVFETEDKSEVEQKCHANDFGFQWNKNDWLEINQTRPAVMAHPVTKEKVWFNQVHLYDFNPKLLGWRNYIGSKVFYCRKHTKVARRLLCK